METTSDDASTSTIAVLETVTALELNGSHPNAEEANSSDQIGKLDLQEIKEDLPSPPPISLSGNELEPPVPALAAEQGEDKPTEQALPEPEQPQALPAAVTVSTTTATNTSTTVIAATTTNATAANHDDDDVTSKAALALAAVAAAASASHKSPAEAAREARAVAQSFISSAASDEHNNKDTNSSSATNTGGGGGTNSASSRSRTPRTVSFAAVRQRLQLTKPAIYEKLDENEAYWKALLLLEYFRCVDDDAGPEVVPEPKATMVEIPGMQQQPSSVVEGGASSAQDEKPDSPETVAIVIEACDRLEAIVKRVEGAYDSLLNLLPAVPANGGTKNNSKSNIANFAGELQDGDFDDGADVIDLDAPVIIPDLLPPCATAQGDRTVAFFRACLGSHASAGYNAGTGANEEGRSTTSDQQIHDQMNNSGGWSAPDPPALQAPPPAPQQQSSLFSSMFRKSAGSSFAATGASVFSRNKKQPNSSPGRKKNEGGTSGAFGTQLPESDYAVTIEREMLGLTVENVLERTVVRTVAPAGPAQKAGAQVGSLIVKVGNVETKHLTHFETIDELRQSNRPLHLVLRSLPDEALHSAREEMGRLIKGSGFGTLLAENTIVNTSGPGNLTASPTMRPGNNCEVVRPLMETDLRLDAYTGCIRRRFADTVVRNKKEEALQKIGEKLIWILTLFVAGLEREAKCRGITTSGRRFTSYHQSHSGKDLADAAKSVAKVLYDYARKVLELPSRGKGVTTATQQKARANDYIQHSLEGFRGVKGRKTPAPPLPPLPGRKMDESTVAHEKPLLAVGDVLQRTRTFFADTTSPPAALLRGELIAFLCDVLDIDTEMELSEEDAVSATTGGARAGAINDLGSSGSLLKLIVLNCPIMRSPGCEENFSIDEDELRRRFGNSELNSVDVHRLHAGNRFLAVVHRLAASRSTSARITACSLGPVLWGHLDFPHQLQLRGVITRALHDVDVMVRKATATVLHEIAELVFDPRAVPWLVLMCERAMTDPEPQLRTAAMTLTWHLAEHLPNAFLGDARQGSRYLRRLPSRDDPTFAEVYLLQCKLLPVATRLAEDRSPSVRLAVAAQCDRLCDALGAHWSSVVIDTLLALLSDTDERVRCEAVSCVPRLSEIVLLSSPPGETAPSEVSVLEALIPASIKLQKDNSVSVRVALAAAAGDLLTLLVALQSRASDAGSVTGESSKERNYKRHVDERLIPMVQTLLNDSDPEVTSSALRAVTNATRSSSYHRARHMSIASEDDSASISSYTSHASRDKPVFYPVLSEVQVLRLLPTLTELGNSKQWRVRQSAVEIVPALLGCTQRLETRMEIAKLCIRLMSDKVDAVRKTAAECLCMGGSSLGSHGEDASNEWISSVVVPNIRRSATHSDSKQRLLSLKMVEVVLLSGACPTKWKGSQNEQDRMTDSPLRELAAIALSLCTDRIANVRLNVGRCLEGVMHVFEEEEIVFIQEVIQQQITSEKERDGGGDRDVIFYANRCWQRAKAIVEEKRVLD